MGQMVELRLARIAMGRLTHGRDLLEELTEICQEKNIRLGRVEAIGAVQRARIGFYDQVQRKYTFIAIEQPLELSSLVGNVSLKDGKPFVHAHITLAENSGRTYGGHLAPGTTVFAGEFVIIEFEGPELAREFDEQTGLLLWRIKD